MDKFNTAPKDNSEVTLYVKGIEELDSTLTGQLKLKYPPKKITLILENPICHDFEKSELCIPKDLYFTQLGYISNKKDLPLKKDDTRHFFCNPKTKDEMIELNTATLDKYFNKPWGNYIGENLISENDVYIRDVFTKERSWSVNTRGENIALISLFSSKDCLGMALDQIGWIWIKDSINPDIRKSIHNGIVELLRTNCSDLIQAGVHIYNYRSQKFFKNLGFKIKCIHIIKKQK